MFGFGHWELLLVTFVAFLLFGHRLPALMQTLGSCIRGLRDGMEESAAQQKSQDQEQLPLPKQN